MTTEKEEKKLLKSFVETIKINVTKIKMSKKDCRKNCESRDYLGFIILKEEEEINQV